MELQAMNSKIVIYYSHWNCFWQILHLKQKPFLIRSKAISLKNVKLKMKIWNQKTKKVYAWLIGWNYLFTYFWRNRKENLQCCLYKLWLSWIIKSFLRMILYLVKYQHLNPIHFLNLISITSGTHLFLVSELTMIILSILWNNYKKG
jgi:hypothetical protein